jgi:acyl carrier protein
MPIAQLLLDWLRKLPTNLSGCPIDVDMSLIETGLLDSLGVLELVSFLEDSFSLELPLDEFVPDNFRSPAAILAMIDRLHASAVSN